MAIVDTDKVRSILSECAERYIIPRYRALENHEINTKSGPQDFVTQADLDVEGHLEKVLPDMLPGSVVVGEEGVSQGKHSLNELEDTSRPIWVVDPLDGTHNFVHHKREFGIMLACVIDGIAEYGFIYDVLGHEMAVAERGSGAYYGSQRLKVNSGFRGIEELTGHINPKFFPKKFKDDLLEAMKRFKDCQSLHCAAHEYMRIASGASQFVVYSKLKPWDHLAGSLLVQEAGGYIALWDGNPYIPKNRDVGLIAAASQENWQTAYDVFLKDFL